MAKEAIQEILQAEEDARLTIQNAKEQAKQNLADGRAALKAEAANLVAQAREKADAVRKDAEERVRAQMQGPLDAAMQKAEALRNQPDSELMPIANRIVEEVLHYGNR